jgi:hypothetical protein
MDAWPSAERLQRIFLMVRAETHALAEGRRENVNEIIDRLEDLTRDGYRARSTMQLRCAAALRQARALEGIILDGMRLDHWISWQEEIVLVHLRIFCAEIMGILMDTLNESRGIQRSNLLL